VLIVSQALLNTFAVLGLAPLTGVPLPLVSYGSSSMIVTLAAMGLLLNVASGATGHVRAVSSPRSSSGDARRREQARLGDDRAQEDRDRRRRDRWARGARAGGRTGSAG
jgi:cell division protein FtsW